MERRTRIKGLAKQKTEGRYGACTLCCGVWYPRWFYLIVAKMEHGCHDRVQLFGISYPGALRWLFLPAVALVVQVFGFGVCPGLI